jgi:glucokinase
MTHRIAVAAVDVGGTKTACGLFLATGELIHSRTEPTAGESAESAAGQIVAMAEAAISEAPVDAVVAGMGIVVPGWVNRASRTVWAPNIKGWDHVPLERQLAERLPIPIFLESDRTGYVKGEAWLGVARGLTDVVFLAVGTGIGAGVLSEGRFLHGHDDLAGCVGWLALNPRYEEIYARIGCFEAEASGNSMGRKGAERLRTAQGGQPASIAARDVIEAASNGNPAAAAIIDEVSVYLGMGVANLVSTLNPQMVVLGGGLFQGGTRLLERVRHEFARWAQPIAARSVRIELSTLGEHAGLYGAARIALDNI